MRALSVTTRAASAYRAGVELGTALREFQLHLAGRSLIANPRSSIAVGIACLIWPTVRR